MTTPGETSPFPVTTNTVEADPISWINEFKNNGTGVCYLWNHCRSRLTRVARSKLNTHTRRVFDEHDLALVVFQNFITALTSGRCENITTEKQLWNFLFSIVHNKACDLLSYNLRDKRGGGLIRGESAFPELGGRSDIVTTESPDFLHELRDQAEEFINSFDDENLKTIILHLIKGHDYSDISIEMGISERTVRRKAALVKQLWKASNG